VSGQPVQERRRLPEPRPQDPLPLYMPRRILGRELRTGPGRPETVTRHGRTGRHTGVPPHHPQ